MSATLADVGHRADAIEATAPLIQRPPVMLRALVLPRIRGSCSRDAGIDEVP